MAYKKGSATMCENKYCYADKDNKAIKHIELPHHCDEWIIGGREETLQFIEDLQELLKEL